MIRRTTTALAAVAATVALMLTGCGADDSDCQGDPGKVSAKDYDGSKFPHPTKCSDGKVK